jgi:MFS family permease
VAPPRSAAYERFLQDRLVEVRLPVTRRSAAAALLCVAVAVAFADSSIVVLALPEVYGRFDTTINGVSWVISGYNAAVAATALAFVFLVHRFRASLVLVGGLALFGAASVACAVAGGLGALVAARAVQGVGAALLLAGALPVLGALTGSAARGATTWTLAGTFGAVVGPALGGVLTEAFDWRAIFIFQAPVAALALVAAAGSNVAALGREGWTERLTRTLPANVCLGLVFGSLVGALFLAVLLVITVWGNEPIAGAGIVSVLPAAAVAVRPLERRLDGLAAAVGGAALLALGLAALALLPAASAAYACPALALCGAGLGLALPPLSGRSLDANAGLTRAATVTVGVRHLGLVIALASVAALLASTLPAAGGRAELKATAVILDAPIGLEKKGPIAVELSRAFHRRQAGEIPDLAAPFNRHGARSDPELAAVRDSLTGTIKATLTRAFRPAFWLCAALAGLAAVTAAVLRRRLVA